MWSNKLLFALLVAVPKGIANRYNLYQQFIICVSSLSAYRFHSEPESHDEQPRDWLSTVLLLSSCQVCSSVSELARTGRNKAVFALHILF